MYKVKEYEGSLKRDKKQTIDFTDHLGAWSIDPEEMSLTLTKERPEPRKHLNNSGKRFHDFILPLRFNVDFKCKRVFILSPQTDLLYFKQAKDKYPDIFKQAEIYHERLKLIEEDGLLFLNKKQAKAYKSMTQNKWLNTSERDQSAMLFEAVAKNDTEFFNRFWPISKKDVENILNRDDLALINECTESKSLKTNTELKDFASDEYFASKLPLDDEKLTTVVNLKGDYTQIIKRLVDDHQWMQIFAVMHAAIEKDSFKEKVQLDFDKTYDKEQDILNYALSRFPADEHSSAVMGILFLGVYSCSDTTVKHPIDMDGNTYYHYAAKAIGSTEFVIAPFKEGTHKKDDFLKHKNKNGETPAMIALLEHGPKVLDHVEKMYPDYDDIIRHFKKLEETEQLSSTGKRSLKAVLKLQADRKWEEFSTEIDATCQQNNWALGKTDGVVFRMIKANDDTKITTLFDLNAKTMTTMTYKTDGIDTVTEICNPSTQGGFNEAKTHYSRLKQTKKFGPVNKRNV